MTLVLRRKVGESIVIGDDEVVVTIVEIREGSVRISIDAPHWVHVYRAELRKKGQPS